MKMNTPPEIEGFQYNGDFINSHGDFYIPEWAVKAYKKGILYYGKYKDQPGELFIKTPKGDKHVEVNDFIIKDLNGEIYSCKLNIL